MVKALVILFHCAVFMIPFSGLRIVTDSSDGTFCCVWDGTLKREGCSVLEYLSMRIAYCTNVRLPSERAHGHQVAQVCDALAHLGHDVTIFAPYRDNEVTEDYWMYYGA